MHDLSLPLYPLSNAVAECPHFSHLQTEPSIWSCDTLADAWEKAYELVREYQQKDPDRLSALKENDLNGLAKCTANLEFNFLLGVLPAKLKDSIVTHPDFSMDTVEEIFLHLGQRIEVRGEGWLVQLPPPTESDLEHVISRSGYIGEDGRANISSTSHRVSVWRGRRREVLGATIRVGRFLPGVSRALVPLAKRGSMLIIGKPGMGKTTLVRDISAALANFYTVGEEGGARRVVVVDSANEICGDGLGPLPFLGRCRRMQVPPGNDQSHTMAEVIQNHSPEYLVIGEILTKNEAEAAWTTTQRGVRLLATCHGETLNGLVNNQSLNLLVGGSERAILSADERVMRNKQKKTILERPHPSPFDFVVEMITRETAFIYINVNKAVDMLLDDKSPQKKPFCRLVTLGEPLPPEIIDYVDHPEDEVSKPKAVSYSSSSSSHLSFDEM